MKEHCAARARARRRVRRRALRRRVVAREGEIRRRVQREESVAYVRRGGDATRRRCLRVSPRAPTGGDSSEVCGSFRPSSCPAWTRTRTRKRRRRARWSTRFACPDRRRAPAAGDAHRYAGEVTHVFSHVKQNTAVWHARAVVEAPGAGRRRSRRSRGELRGGGNGVGCRRMTSRGRGLSSGPVKVHALVTGKKGTKGGKTARTPPPVKESAIGKMFAAQKRRKTEEEP